MLIFTLAMAMTMTMLVATFFNLGAEKRHIEVKNRWRENPAGISTKPMQTKWKTGGL